MQTYREYRNIKYLTNSMLHQRKERYFLVGVPTDLVTFLFGKGFDVGKYLLARDQTAFPNI